MSDGDYVSYGWFESDDLSDILVHLSKEGLCSSVVLWGRNLGGAVALMREGRIEKTDLRVDALVIDSAYASLSKMIDVTLVGLFSLFAPSFPHFFLLT